MKFVKSILLIIAFISIVGFMILSLIKTTPQKQSPEQEAEEAEEENPKAPVQETFNASASAVSDAVIVEEKPIQ
jgi:hypothetical protein